MATKRQAKRLKARSARRAQKRRMQTAANQVADDLLHKELAALLQTQRDFADAVRTGSLKKKGGKRIGDNSLTASGQLHAVGDSFGGRYAWDTRYFAQFPDVNERPHGNKRPRPPKKWFKKQQGDMSDANALKARQKADADLQLERDAQFATILKDGGVLVWTN